MNEILLGKNQRAQVSAEIHLHAKYGNRHGMIAVATGKTGSPEIGDLNMLRCLLGSITRI